MHQRLRVEIFVLGILFVVWLWAESPSWVPFLMRGNSQIQPIDGFNALFTGMALAGVVATLLLQQKQLDHQERELERQSKEAAKAAEDQREQLKLLTLTAYLNALEPMREMLPRADLHADQLHALGRIEKVLEVIHPLATEFATGLGKLPSRDFLLSQKLAVLIGPVRGVVIPPNGKPELNFEKITDQVDPALTKFKELQKSLIDDRQRERGIKIKNLFEKVNGEAVARRKRGFRMAGHDEAGFSNYLVDCISLISEIDSFIQDLKNGDPRIEPITAVDEQVVEQETE